MYKILSGKEPSDALLEELKAKVKKMAKKPHLAIVLVGNDPASEIYVKKKLEKAKTTGVKTTLREMDGSTSEKELLELVDKLNNDHEIHGFIVQSPLPEQIDEKKVIEAIDPKKDVDGWTSSNMGRMFVGLDTFLPATPAGVMKILDYYGIELEGKNITVIGRSNVVGKPLAFLLLQRNATVTICHSKTKDLSMHTKNADIIVAAAGKPGLVTAEMVKKGACIIDVGTTRVDGRLKGDVDFDNVIKKAHCSPVPGGVGPMTVAILIGNVVRAMENSN
ncbi:bifunctional 5,10-methylene-tetrahydrofolate dehydrogenase/5,10-methylene-tetrahydrofolate cyclohydrolase [Candidatus Micrarchaeota archaeon]|nr:bifunctional 5,10-methylene-tetrahydrofolate dehydrogenase/5,10-methylene-tetrahydrofolate cyclohydrolase [Candidatus Micrarchaeota archaeon]